MSNLKLPMKKTDKMSNLKPKTTNEVSNPKQLPCDQLDIPPLPLFSQLAHMGVYGPCQGVGGYISTHAKIFRQVIFRQ